MKALSLLMSGLPFTATLSSYNPSGSALSPSAITSNTVTGTPAHGIGPYTYSWAVATTDAIYATVPTGATTAFTRGISSPGGSYSATATLTITDSRGAKAVSPPAFVSLVSSN